MSSHLTRVVPVLLAWYMGGVTETSAIAVDKNSETATPAQFQTSTKMELILIPKGEFVMGSQSRFNRFHRASQNAIHGR